MASIGLKCYILYLVTIISSVKADQFPCSVVDGDVEYDLSELAERDYWEYTETLHTGLSHKKVYYISVCHPLRNAPEICHGANTGVCTKSIEEGGTTHIGNAGQVPTTGLIVHNAGWIQYTYDNGELCNIRGKNETYQTYLYIMCANNKAEETPHPVLMTSPGCQLIFAWMTMAACSKKVDNTKPTTCLTTFPNSSHTLNLYHLHSLTHYTVLRGNSTYEVNICGAVSNGSCGSNATVCLVNAAAAPVTVATNADMALGWRNDILVLTYKDQSTTVEVEFHCDRATTKPLLHYVDGNTTFTTFTTRTSTICTPIQDPLCVVEDHFGIVYDLRPLHKITGNWEAPDTISSDKYELYQINVCGPINNRTYFHCPGGPIGACGASLGKNATYNLGFLTSDPVVVGDGTLTLVYTGGDPCMDNKYSRSTRINFICSKMEQGPVFIEKSATCEHVFKWLTPAACPRHKTTGNNCQVKDPLYSNIYELSPLRNSKKDYVVNFGEEQYLVNLCGPLVSSCNGEAAGVCQIIGSQKFSGGLATSEVVFDDGTLSMEFENGTRNCHGNKTGSSRIIFFCNHDKSGRDGPEIIPNAGCPFNFVWQTVHACPPFRVVDCSYSTSNGYLYDLNELSSSHVNREYYVPGGNKKYVLNVCRSVVHSKYSRCPYTAGACVIDLTHENQSKSIGEVHSGLYMENNKLKIRYTDGEPCGDSQTPSQTIIEFICDKEGEIGYPQFLAVENCTYFFELKTRAACPIMTPDSPGVLQSGENCRVNSSVTGYMFDLNSLKNDDGYEVHDDKDLHFTLNVCAAVNNNKCPGEGTGACSYHDNDPNHVRNDGKANAKLHLLPGFLFLYYTGGDQCSSTAKRSTYISFICGAENAIQGPVLIHDDLDRCTYFINWYTEAACEKRIDCFVDTWTSRLDLSPLIKSTSNYEIVNPNKPQEKFHMNVCRPLNPIKGVNCKPGSAACFSSSSFPSGPLNLGHPSVGLVYVYKEGVKMMYTHGSPCPNTSGYDISTMTYFICDKSAGKGNPVFKNVTHDCQYQFEWHTALVCEDTEEPPSGPVCQIRYDDAMANVDLKPLHRPQGYSVSYGDKHFKINVCGPACNESGVCTSDGQSYGLSSKSELKWDYKSLKLTYYEGNICPASLSGHKTTSIYFDCDMSAGYGYPIPDELINSLQCIAIFHWKTNLTCLEAIYDTEVLTTVTDATAAVAAIKEFPDGDSPDQESSSSVYSVVAIVLVVCGLVYVAVVVLFKSARGQRVVATTRRILGAGGYNNISQTRTENTTLLGTTVSARVCRVDESDDDLLRV